MAVATPTHETLTCPVCLQFYRAPKVLPCMHIFCQRCLQTVALQSDSRKLKCPTCKTRAAIPEGGVADFPTNVFIADELERLEKNNEKKPEKCATHKTEIALFVCAQCDAAVCSECRITEHRDHHVEDLEDAINWTKNELQDGMVRLVDCKRALDSVMGKVSADRDAVTEKRRALEIILSDRKRRAIQMAEETFVDAMASLDLVTLDIESEFDDNDSLIQERLKIVTKLQGKVKSAFEGGSYRKVMKARDTLRSGPGSPESLEQLISDLQLLVFRPLLVCDDNCPLDDTLKLFIGRVVTDQQIQAAELPEVVVQREFRCFEDEHEDVHAICPREDGRVWVAHGHTVTGDEAESWVGLHTNHGAIERRETVTGRVGITRISNSMVIVEGRGFKTKSMTPEETTEWTYAGAELLYRVYSKFQARFFIGVDERGECDLRIVTVTDPDSCPRTKATKLTCIRAKQPVAMDATADGRFIAVLEEGENHVLLFHLNERAPFTTYIDPFTVYRQDSRVFTPRDVCFFELGGREWLVVADWQGDSLHVLEVSLGGCTFLGHLGAGSPWIVKPSALTADDTGRLWVGCRFGHVLTVKPRN